MNFKEYTDNCKITFNYQDRPKDITHCILGMIDELGEIAKEFKREIGYGHKITKNNIIEEVGDFMYFFTMLFNLLEVDKSDEGENILSRFNAICESRPVASTKPIPPYMHSVALSKATSTLIALIEQGDGENIIAVMENMIIIARLLAASSGKTLSKVLDINIAKLKERYGEKFSKAASYEKNRDRDKEGKVIETKSTGKAIENE